MSERKYGYRYDRSRRTKEDAALIRADIKTMQSAGMLPVDWKFSVRSESFAGGSAINIRAVSPRPIGLMTPGQITTAPGKHRVVVVPYRERESGEVRWINLHMRPGDMHEVRRFDTESTESRAVRDALEDLHNAYNHDGSDTMTDHFDVKFYGGVSVETFPGVPEYERERPSWRPASCDVRH